MTMIKRRREWALLETVSRQQLPPSGRFLLSPERELGAAFHDLHRHNSAGHSLQARIGLDRSIPAFTRKPLPRSKVAKEVENQSL